VDHADPGADTASSGLAPPCADFDGLGFRVPLLVISPYAKQGYVSHVQFRYFRTSLRVEDLLRMERDGSIQQPDAE
jgi:phospholipase C